MKYNLILLTFLFSCTINTTKLENRTPYNSTGFAYIFNYDDFEEKIIKGKLDNSQIQISHNRLNIGTLKL